MATVVSSVLNSVWTMLVIFCKICGCQGAKTRNCSCFSGKANLTPSSTKISGYWKLTGRISLGLFVFLTFSLNAIQGLMPIGHITGSFLVFKLSPFNLRKEAVTYPLGPGLDSLSDEAMYIYLKYVLPESYHIALYDEDGLIIRNSAPIDHLYNRLYVGQFKELSHLKDGTLTKAIPCSRAFPYLNNINKSDFLWNDSRHASDINFENCKLIFKLRYHPTSSYWNPFKNFYPDYYKNITIDWGFHINDDTSCPKGLKPIASEDFLKDQVRQDIVDYICNATCGNHTDICHEANGTRLLTTSGNEISGNITWSVSDVHFTINNMKYADTCAFYPSVYFKQKLFCNKLWSKIKFSPVNVPEKIRNKYPQFITTVMTYNMVMLHAEVTDFSLINECGNLWKE